MSRFFKLFSGLGWINRGPQQSSTYWSEFKNTTSDVIKAGCFIHVFREYVMEYSVCVGPSMLPTLQPRGDVLLHEKHSIWRQTIAVGDVVISRSPSNPNHIVCKRVLALAGDTVRVPCTSKSDSLTVTVPEGHVWLQGDNTLNSSDSRQYGPVPYALLRGRAFARFRWLPPFESSWVKSFVPDDVTFPLRKRSNICDQRAK